jgi:hypothetical protein
MAATEHLRNGKTTDKQDATLNPKEKEDEL